MKVKDEDIIEEVCAVPATEDHHLCAVNEVGGVVETRGGCTATFGTLEPSHGKRVKRMQVSEDCVRALSSKNNYSGAS